MISYNVLQKSLISQKYKKNSPGKYALLLYLTISIRCISIMFDAVRAINLWVTVIKVSNIKQCMNNALFMLQVSLKNTFS